MNRPTHKLSSLAVALLIVSAAGEARAQRDIGVKLSETSVLHLSVTAEGGYDTNVFYNDQARQESAFMRIIPAALITNAGRNGDAVAEVIYSLGATLVYREYINNQQDVRQQRAFNPTFSGSLATGAGHNLSLSIGDQFTRIEEAPYSLVQPPAPGAGVTMPGPAANTGIIVRDANLASGTVGVSPGGGRITGTFRYTNRLDYFETPAYKGSSNMGHDVMLDLSWKWLPKTALYLQLGAGYIQYLNSSDPASAVGPRYNSIPIRATAGLRGLLTPKVTFGLGAGYGTAIYSGGTGNPSGASNVVVAADLGYSPTLFSRIGLGYSHGFQNSPVIGNFYDLDAVNLSLSQSLGKVVATAFGRYEHRAYHGYVINAGTNLMGINVQRSDDLVVGGLQFDYYLKKWLYAGVAYGITLDRPTVSISDPTVDKNAAQAAAYTKHQVFARIGVSY